MKLKIGQKYRIIGPVSENHGDCVGDIIECAHIDGSFSSFHGLRWCDYYDKDDIEFILCSPYDVKFIEDVEDPSSINYEEWLDTVLEEVE